MEAIDVHIHGFLGLDTKDATHDNILKIAEGLFKKGITGFLPTVYPRSISHMREDMDSIKKAMIIQKKEGIQGQAEIMGIHLEGPFLNPARCGSLDKKAFLMPNEKNFKSLIEGFEDVIKLITIAPELDGALKIIEKAVERGITVSMGHSDARFEDAEAGFNAGARGITHILNAMRPIHHREPGIAGFGIMNPEIYIEVIADAFHLHKKIIEMIFRIKDPEHIILVSDAVKYTGLMSPVEADGVLIGGAMTIVESAKRIINEGFEKDMVLKCISLNPSRYLMG
ncbi:MAG TPA: amidohydrolase family protein [Syntrophorhabdaceae bacterium]|nr:amidohydrolase family protein [Syntrophorhabdaceae bacterium]HPU29149.1 amidohydrolase family protein [Syntrophorhabdaceae bacterium]